MASTPRTPARPERQPPASTQPRHVEVLAEIPLSRPLRDLGGKPMESIRFVRAPAMGEIMGYLKPTGPEDFEAALQRLLVDPEWIGFVLSRCASVPMDQYRLMAFQDYAACIPVIADFIGGSRETGGSA